MESCDIFFYNVGMRLGIDRLSYYGSHLGIGHKTGIDLPSEEPGLMPSEEWVERTFHRKWYAGETISVSTGQGAVITTPLQLARHHRRNRKRWSFQAAAFAEGRPKRGGRTFRHFRTHR